MRNPEYRGNISPGLGTSKSRRRTFSALLSAERVAADIQREADDTRETALAQAQQTAAENQTNAAALLVGSFPERREAAARLAEDTAMLQASEQTLLRAEAWLADATERVTREVYIPIGAMVVRHTVGMI